MYAYSCKVAVVVTPTITGRSEFKRCMKSLKIAEKSATVKEIKYFISDKETSRDKFLEENIEEISKYDLVTFVEDSDYVGKYFFKFPFEFDKFLIHRANCRTLEIQWDYMGDTPMEEMCARFWGYISSETPLENFHLWGYFFPVDYIESLVKKVITGTENGVYGEICYWAYIIAHFNYTIKGFGLPDYYHVEYIDYPYLDLTEKELKSNLEANKRRAQVICKDILFEGYYGRNKGYLIDLPKDKKSSSLAEFVEIFKLRKYATDLEKKLLCSSFLNGYEDGWQYSVKETEKFLNLLGSSIANYLGEIPTEDEW